MGFAHRNQDGVEGTAFIGKDCKLSSGGFTCPRWGHVMLHSPLITVLSILL